MSSFKRQKYGMVKPVKQVTEKAKHPDVREIKRIYLGLSKLGTHQALDMLAHALAWWVTVAKFYNDSPLRTVSQSRKITKFLDARRSFQSAKTDEAKIAHAIAAIQCIEGVSEKHIPKIKKYYTVQQKTAKKQEAIVDKLGERFERITTVLAKMFPSCTLQLVIVPQIIDPVTNKDIGHKLDHSRDTIYYSRAYMKAMRVKWRRQGILAIAIEEAWWLARAMSLKPTLLSGRLEVDTELHIRNYKKLMDEFEEWARRKETPARLARKPSKPKKKMDEMEETELTATEEELLSEDENMQEQNEYQLEGAP